MLFRRGFWLFGLSGALLSAAPAAPRPPLMPFRLDEDWTFLRDPAARISPVDRVKFVPLGAAGTTSLTFGGEVRHRWEYYQDDAWGGITTNDRNGYHHLRLNLFADVRRTDGWRGFVELKSGLVRGSRTVVKPPDRDDLDLHQAFLERRWPVGPDATVLVRGGRQELNYGGMRIVTFRDGPNVRQSFDAGIARWQRRGSWKVDAFYARPAETDIGRFDDQTNDKQLIYGLYGVTPIPALAGANLDLYALGFDRDNARFQTGIGNERRYSIGSRFWGRRGALDFNFEALWQWGTFRDEEIAAWTFASDTGYTLAKAPTSPRLYLKANIISGDRSMTDKTLHAFNALYPRGAYFGDIGQIGPANLINLHPGVAGKFNARWGYHVDTVIYWRESDRDGLYNPAGVLIRVAGASRANFIGTQSDATLSWQPNRYLSIELTYARFWAGDYVRESGPGEDVDYASLLTRFRF